MEGALYGIYALVVFVSLRSLFRLIFCECNYWEPHPNLEEIEEKKKKASNSCLKCVLQNTLHVALPSKSCRDGEVGM